MPRQPIVKKKIASIVKEAKSGLSFQEITDRVGANKGVVSRDLRALVNEGKLVCKVIVSKTPNRAVRLRKVFLYNETEDDVFNGIRYRIVRCFLPRKTEERGTLMPLVGKWSIAQELKKRYTLPLRSSSLKPLIYELVRDGLLRHVRPGRRKGGGKLRQTDTSTRPQIRRLTSREYSYVVPVPTRIGQETYQLTTRGFDAALLSAVKLKESVDWHQAAFLYRENFGLFRFWDLFVGRQAEQEIIERHKTLIDNKSNFVRYEPADMYFKMEPDIAWREMLFPLNREEAPGLPGFSHDYPWVNGLGDLTQWVSLLKSNKELRSNAKEVVWQRYKMYEKLASEWRNVWREIVAQNPEAQ